MSVADAGINWAVAVIAAPFVALLFWALGKMLFIIYGATRIEGNGQFAQAQDSVYSGSVTALNLAELASSIETWVLFIVFVLAVGGAFSQLASSGGRR